MYSHYKELISLNEKGTKYTKKDQNNVFKQIFTIIFTYKIFL